MQKSVSLIFPHQLFLKNIVCEQKRPVILIEESLYFKQYPFHQAKLVLHRASMKFYEEYLQQQGFEVMYVETRDDKSDIRQLLKWLHTNEVQNIYYIHTTDYWLERRISTTAKQFSIKPHTLPTPMFMTGMKEADEFFKNRKSYFQTDFYKWQRKQQNILMEASGEPKGGK